MAPRALVFLLCAAALALVPCADAINATKGIISPTSLPSFIPRCSYKDSNFTKCIVESANHVIEKITEGYPPLNLPCLDPLAIDEINLNSGTRASSFNLHARNIIITGLAKTVMLDCIFDFENDKFTSTFFIPWLQIEADYDVDGQILMLPIKGNGRANITFEKSTYVYIQPYKTVKRNGKEHYNFPPSQGQFNTIRAHFHLDNLFHKDKVLGDQINIFLNENWRDVIDDIGIPFTDTATKVIHDFLVALTSRIPNDEIYIDVD